MTVMEFNDIIMDIKCFVDILQEYYIVAPIIKMNPNTYKELESYISADNICICIKDNQAKTHLCGLEIEIDDTIPYGSIIICKNENYMMWKLYDVEEFL